METEKTIPLRKPISIGAVEYVEIKLVEPTAGQLRKASKAGSAIDSLCVLIHLVAKVPEAVVDQLPQTEFEAMADFLGSFSSEAPTTSAMSSPS